MAYLEKSKQSVASKQDIEQRNAEEKRSQAPSQKSEKKSQQPSEKHSVRSGQSSETSSVASKSVYQVEGDDEDEWATLVKFDTELFKKEKEL